MSKLTTIGFIQPLQPLVRRGNQAQHQNFRSFSKFCDPLSEISSPFIPFTPMGLYGEPLYSADQPVSTTPHSFQWSGRGLLRAGTTVLPMQAEHPSSLCAVGWWGGSGKVAVSLLPDNGGTASCLWRNKGTSLLLVLFILMFFFFFKHLKRERDPIRVELKIETF